MPGPVLTAHSALLCPHAGAATIVTANNRVRLGGAPVITVFDSAIVAGCANAPAPCVRISWPPHSSRVLAGGAPVVTQYSVGLALTANGAAAGSPIVTATAQRVSTG